MDKFFKYYFYTGLIFLMPLYMMASAADTLKTTVDFYIASYAGDVDYDDAEAYYLNAIEEYRHSDCEALFSTQLYLGDYYRFRRKPALSTAHMDTAKQLMQDCGIEDKSLRAVFLRFLARKENNAGQVDKALKLNQKAISLLHQNQSDTSAEAAAIFYSKGLIFQRQFRLDSAEIYLEAAYRYLQQKYPRPNIYYLHYLLSLAQVYHSSGQLLKAAQTNEMMVRISEEYNIRHNRLIAKTYITLGNIYSRRQEFEKALSAYYTAMEMMGDRNILDKQARAALFYNIGLIYKKEARYFEAINWYRKVLEFENDAHSSLIANTYSGLANIFLALDSLSKAGRYYDLNLDFCSKTFGHQNINTAKALIALGNYYKEMGMRDSILPGLQRAYKIFAKLDPDNPRAVDCRNYLAEYFAENRQPDSALFYYNEAQGIYPPMEEIIGKDAVRPDAKFEIDESLIDIMHGKGRLFLALSKEAENIAKQTAFLEKSLAAMDTAIRLLDKYMQSFTVESSKLGLSEDFEEIYETAILAASRFYELHKTEYAAGRLFYFLEKYKSAVLKSEILAAGNLEQSVGETSLLRRERELRREIAILKASLDGLEDKSFENKEFAGLNKRLFDLYRKQEKLMDSIRMNNPEYARLSSDFEPAGIEEIREVLDEQECLVEYFAGDSLLLGFFLSRDSLSLIFREIDQSFEEQVNDISASTRKLNAQSFNRDLLTDYTRQLHDLYTFLLDTSFIRKCNNLIIVPDKYLNNLPFDILAASSPGSLTSLAEIPFLINKLDITYDYSADLYHRFYRKKHRQTPRVAGFAPIYDYPQAEALPELPASPQEVVDISKYFDVKAFFRFQASEKNFKDQSDDFSILHLAMHTSIDSINPAFSKLLFAPVDSTAEDGKLNVAEIYNLDISAGLTVLSGCNSGYGKLYGTDGLISLARAFYLAGCPSIVMNLWEVEDEVSKMIFDRFYFHLSKGKGRGEALRLAKLDFLKTADPRFHHPHYWGGFVLSGQKDVFVERFGLRQFVLAGAIVLSLIIIFLIIRKTGKKRS